MSFGDPNNPYAPQQGGAPGQQPGQPGAGHPYPGPGYPQPGHGYPQAPPLQPYGAGGIGGPGGFAPMAPLTKPGTVKAAQVLMWVIVALQILGAVVMFGLGAMVAEAKKSTAADDETANLAEELGFAEGVFYAFGVFAILWLIVAVFLATRFNSGGNGMRITIMIFGILTAVLALYPFTIMGLLHLVPAILIAVFTGNSNGSAWFNRPRH
ncbi:hypothetical protein [Streptomyces clavuligerus]|uniref:Putative integral membrane protein n=1 Tax=Streptomyces clavuligerus TaxID=1901 RepID=E2Q395_STRCL|nr:hypothetical protein [Streptomyces clavuligerus]ANW18539.1 hypothetical protein BB341_09995 [Streptomyces clavuligerus]AXU13099.1 hypothetical protein D1794_10340 [Streptomyces clavuligerus]EFG08810.1 Putative integral membrane protein [Streptomyces clavuligerus]MBY6303038.1 hypothetical protein [Streptomyces clavuligerus]QCS05882.1 hypothetical protein CRV15_09770 [Streptomyces clavuligerus]